MGVTLWPEQADTLVPDSVFDDNGVTQPHAAYRADPIAWANDKLGIRPETLLWSLNAGYETHPWDGTADPIATALRALALEQDVGAESGTGTGKSYGLGAVVTLWFLACWENALVFTFAPKEDQLKLFIWKNIGELWPRFKAHFPTAEITDLCIRMRGGLDESWAAHGYAVGIKAGETVSTKASGMHAEHMLLIYEEMPGIAPQVVAAGENACTAPHNLRLGLGNPNNKLDPLHKFCSSPGVVPVRISALDHPNVVLRNPAFIPGAVSQKSIDSRRWKYGETSPVYQSRVRGISPEQASDALIRHEWLVASDARFQARKLAGTLPRSVTGKGVDVANSEHGDRACIANFYDNVLPAPVAFQCPDANKLGRQVKLEMDGARLDDFRCAVDCIGVGAGTVNELRRLGRNVNAVNVGAKPMNMVEKAPDGRLIEWAPDVNMFRSLGDQMHWQLREDLRLGVIDVERDDELWEELTSPTYDDTSKVVVVEPKDEVKVKIGRSPDKGDAVRLANWVRKRAVIPPEPEEREGQSLGYDYAKQQPRQRETADSVMSKWLGEGQTDARGGRYRVPVRRA